MANEPMDEPEYLYGVKVVDIGDLRVSRGLTRRPYSSCRHMSLTYDPKERRIWCRDCETDVDAFDAFIVLVENYNHGVNELNARDEKLREAEAFQVRSVAAKNIDKAWRKRNMVPACPHCSHGLFPEYFAGGFAMLGKDYAKARISAKNKDTKG